MFFFHQPFTLVPNDYETILQFFLETYQFDMRQYFVVKMDSIALSVRFY